MPYLFDSGRVSIPKEEEGDVEAVHHLQLKVHLVFRLIFRSRVCGFKMWALGFTVEDVGFRVWNLEFIMMGFRVSGLAFSWA